MIPHGEFPFQGKAWLSQSSRKDFFSLKVMADLQVKSSDGSAAVVAVSVCSSAPPEVIQEVIQLVRDVAIELSTNGLAIKSAHVETSGGASGVYAALHIYPDPNSTRQG